MNEELVWKASHAYKQAHTLNSFVPHTYTLELDFLRHKGVFQFIVFFFKTCVDIRITDFLPVQEE